MQSIGMKLLNVSSNMSQEECSQHWQCQEASPLHVWYRNTPWDPSLYQKATELLIRKLPFPRLPRTSRWTCTSSVCVCVCVCMCVPVCLPVPDHSSTPPVCVHWILIVCACIRYCICTSVCGLCLCRRVGVLTLFVQVYAGVCAHVWHWERQILCHCLYMYLILCICPSMCRCVTLCVCVFVHAMQPCTLFMAHVRCVHIHAWDSKSTSTWVCTC